MNNAMQYLETLGRTGIAGGEQLDPSTLAPDVRTALLERDPVALRMALGLAPTFACVVAMPNDDEREFEEQPAAPDDQPAEHEQHVA